MGASVDGVTRSGAALAVAAAIVLAGCSGSEPGGPGGDAGTVQRPPPSAGHDLVYDDALRLVLLVNAGLGGASSSPSSTPTQLWGWNGTRWSLLDDAGPPVRNLGGVAYDVGRDVLVLHGGSYSAQLSYGDTWEWRSDAGWRRIDVPGPGIRDHTQMAYDPLRGQVVLFGGQQDPTAFPSDTWTWDGGQWDSVSGPSPGGRVHHAMQYDPGAQRIIAFGGFQPPSDRGDTWAWDGGTWVELPPQAAPRTHGRMAFDEGRGGLVFVGGLNATDGVLLRQNGSWSPLGVAGAPGTRYLPGVAYDRGRGVLVVFGGGDPVTNQLFGDTWELDGAAWHRRDGP